MPLWAYAVGGALLGMFLELAGVFDLAMWRGHEE